MSVLPTNTKLSAFIEACLEPLSDDVLIDTHYNSIIRQQRMGEWRRADCKRRCFEAMLQVATCTDKGHSFRVRAPVTVPPRDECLKLWRKAVAEQLLTPIEHKANIAWKKRQDLRYLPIDPGEVEAAIVADEAFLAAHPTKRTHRRAD